MNKSDKEISNASTDKKSESARKSRAKAKSAAKDKEAAENISQRIEEGANGTEQAVEKTHNESVEN